MSMIDYVIGAGQGGCRLGKVFSEEFEVPSTYLNFAGVDFAQLDIPAKSMHLMESGGTGRDPLVGWKLAKEHKEDITDFLDKQFPKIRRDDKVVVCIGGGGGSGAGMLPILVNWCLRRRTNVLLVMTLPEKQEGLPAKPNALKTLNMVIKKYLEPGYITAMVIDNEYVMERYGSEEGNGSYWNQVNRGIVLSLLRFWYLTNMEKFAKYIDVTAGYGALDERELLRVLYTKGGFIDLREFTCEGPDEALAKTAKFKSMIFGNLDIASAKSYIVTVGLPPKLRTDDRVHGFLNALFNKLQRLTKTSFVLRSSHFNSKLSTIKVNLLLSGLAKSHGLKKIIAQTVKDVEKYKEKGGMEEMDLSQVDF